MPAVEKEEPSAPGLVLLRGPGSPGLERVYRRDATSPSVVGFAIVSLFLATCREVIRARETAIRSQTARPGTVVGPRELDFKVRIS